MQDTLLQQGLDLMLFGMGTVFVFLTLLVFITVVISFLVQQYFPDKEPLHSKMPIAGSGSTTASQQGMLPDPRTLSIIKAALKQHRKKRR